MLPKIVFEAICFTNGETHRISKITAGACDVPTSAPNLAYFGPTNYEEIQLQNWPPKLAEKCVKTRCLRIILLPKVYKRLGPRLNCLFLP